MHRKWTRKKFRLRLRLLQKPRKPLKKWILGTRSGSSLVTGLNAAATSLSTWVAGGNDNINRCYIRSSASVVPQGQDCAWDNNLDLEYGMSYIDQKDDKIQKPSDRIKFNSKVGYEFAPNGMQPLFSASTHNSHLVEATRARTTTTLSFQNSLLLHIPMSLSVLTGSLTIFSRLYVSYRRSFHNRRSA